MPGQCGPVRLAFLASFAIATSAVAADVTQAIPETGSGKQDRGRIFTLHILIAPGETVVVGEGARPDASGFG
jgi:hypothetical protein